MILLVDGSLPSGLIDDLCVAVMAFDSLAMRYASMHHPLEFVRVQYFGGPRRMHCSGKPPWSSKRKVLIGIES